MRPLRILALTTLLLAGACTDPYGQVDYGRTALLGIGVGAAAALAIGAASDRPRPYYGGRPRGYGGGGYGGGGYGGGGYGGGYGGGGYRGGYAQAPQPAYGGGWGGRRW